MGVKKGLQAVGVPENVAKFGANATTNLAGDKLKDKKIDVLEVATRAVYATHGGLIGAVVCAPLGVPGIVICGAGGSYVGNKMYDKMLEDFKKHEEMLKKIPTENSNGNDGAETGN